MKGEEREKLEEFIREVVDRLPAAFSGLRSELNAHLCAALEPWLHKMNLVSREEYDIQVALLERLRKRVAELEKHLNEKG